MPRRETMRPQKWIARDGEKFRAPVGRFVKSTSLSTRKSLSYLDPLGLILSVFLRYKRRGPSVTGSTSLSDLSISRNVGLKIAGLAEYVSNGKRMVSARRWNIKDYRDVILDGYARRQIEFLTILKLLREPQTKAISFR